MVKFTYNNAKNASTNCTLFELNYSYYSRVLFKKDIDPHLRSHFANELAEKLRKLIEVCCQNLFYIYKL